jgi:hypothetical protein
VLRIQRGQVIQSIVNRQQINLGPLVEAAQITEACA